MNFNEFKYLEETKISVISKLEYLKDGGLKDYFEYAFSEMNIKKLPSKKNDQIIEQIISKSPNDLNKKENNKEYYKGHLCAIKFVLDKMFLHDAFIDNLKHYKEEDDKDMIVYNYYHVLQEILFDMSLLIQDYNHIFNRKLPENPIWKNFSQHNFTLYKLLPQLIFGQVSFHSNIEREPYVAIAVIRQTIEIKIRKAFGIMGIYDKSKDSLEPFSLGQIFEVLKKFENEIDFAIPLSNIVRINGWSNIFVHSGMKDFSWTPIFVYLYLNPLIVGVSNNNSYNLDSGIKLKLSTLNRIIAEFETIVNNMNDNFELYKSTPDVYVIAEQ